MKGAALDSVAAAAQRETLPPINTMTAEEQRFLQELDLFRGECEASSQHLYAYLAIHALAKRRKQVFRTLDRSALFWNTVLGALQTSSLITLGRIFDQDTPHNVDVLLRLAQSTPTMFLKPALGRRKHNTSEPKPEWLDKYVAQAYEPTASDFRSLRAHVKKARRIYEARYRELRRQIFAHKVAHVPDEVAPITTKANINELKRLISSLLSLYEALFELFWNGRQPVLRRLRYAAKAPKGQPASTRPHEQIVIQAERVLLDAARPNRALQPTSRARRTRRGSKRRLRAARG